MKPDENGVAMSGNAYQIDCQDTLLRSENENQQIVGLGLKDIVAVAMNDAVLSQKERSQDVRELVGSLAAQDIAQRKFFKGAQTMGMVRATCYWRRV